MPFFCPKGGPLHNPYELLNLEHGATDDDIARSFKRLMLQLHPDKQPADQTAEEAEEVSHRLHMVMDARSFLLDGEHLAARRVYDETLVRAKQNAKVAALNHPAKPQSEQPQASQPQASSTDSKSNIADPPKSSPPGENSDGQSNDIAAGVAARKDGRDPDPATQKQQNGGGKKNKENPRSYANKGTNVKQWGKAPRHKGNHKGNNTRVRRAPSRDGDESENTKPHPFARSHHDVFDHCTTTEERSYTSDDETQRRAYTRFSNGDRDNNKHWSNRPLNSSKHDNNNGVRPKESNGKELRKYHKRHSGGAPIRATGASIRREKDADCGKERARTEVPRKESRRSHRPRSKSNDFDGTEHNRSSSAPHITSDFSPFYPAVDSLERQYHCPLTKRIMKEPMSDFEGNTYERSAILRYLETHNTSPVTGNPLYPLHLTANSALKEKIRYTMKLKSTLDALQSEAGAVLNNPTDTNNFSARNCNQQQQQPGHARSAVESYRTLQEAVDSFIDDLNCNSTTNIRISTLDSSGITSFTYSGLKFRLEVPPVLLHDNIVLQTWYEHSKKAAGIEARVVKFNASLQKVGLGGKLTFRHMKGKYAFTLTKELSPKNFRKVELRHSIEYFIEMSMKLHNVINSADVKRVDKVRLVGG